MTYLNTGWAGPSPKRVIDRMHDVAQRETAAGPASPDGHALAQAIDQEARAAVAGLLDVSADDVLLTHGTTEGVNVVLQGIDWQSGDVLLTTDLEHPGVKAPSAILETRRGVSVERATIRPNASGSEILETIAGALGPRTKLVALSHIMFTCGLRVPAKEIVRAAHDAGALVLFDGAQTGGQIALDLADMHSDFYAISGQKWLMGPAGTGALYVSPEHRDQLRPVFTGPGLDSRTGLAMHALTSQGVVTRAGFAEAIHCYAELRADRVEQRTAELAERLRAGLTELQGVTLNGPTSGDTATALTAVSVVGRDPEEIVTELWGRHRVVARNVAYPAGVRFCTAAFNDEADVDRALEALHDLVR